MYFYTKKEDLIKDEESLYDQKALKEIFEDYNHFPPSLSAALYELFLSTGINSQIAEKFTNEILSKSKAILESNKELLIQQYPTLSEKESLIIASYTCEFEDPNYRNYSPRKIMNIKLCETNGIYSINKYFYLFLKSLRQLDRYYPKQKVYYRCINKKVDLEFDYLNDKVIPYEKGVYKTFNGFTSITSEKKENYTINNKKIDVETIFYLTGNYWGYDISPFNKQFDEEIILEPEQTFIVKNIANDVKKGIIHILCEITYSPFVLEEIIQRETYKIKIKFKKKFKVIRIFGSSFCNNNINICTYIYNNKEYRLREFLDVSDAKNNEFEIILKGISKTKNLSHMFDCCQNIYSLEGLSNLNISHVNNISYMFHKCESLSLLSDISNWNTSNVNNMSHLFSNCLSLLILPDITKWKTDNVNDMSSMFANCNSLSKIPNISKWNINNVQNMSKMFFCCKSLFSLQCLSKWKTFGQKIFLKLSLDVIHWHLYHIS